MVTLARKPQDFISRFFDYCHKSYQCLSRDFGLFVMRKIGRFELIRDLVRSFSQLSYKSPEISENQASMFQNINADQVVSTMKKDGYYVGLQLPQDLVQELRKLTKSEICYGDRNHNFSFHYNEKEKLEEKIGKKIMLGSYLNYSRNWSAFRKLANDPTLLAIAAKYLGTNPQCIESEIAWSFPVQASWFEQMKAAQVYHYDLDDYRSIKFFFYLTDVDLSSGPHAYIRSTHKNKKLLHQLLGQRCAGLGDQNILDNYGPENEVTVCGTAGLGFVGDTCCFHKGSIPTEKERLLLQIEFAINKYQGLRLC
ncbi:hypothetical protein [Lyngbya aestuarii]|uniref:hypothetical protein n=1 Tax=Lyngbya aestuarii TaxID=118322 RepID=UPI00403DBD9E